MTQGGRRRALDAFPRRPPLDAQAPIPLTVFGINEADPGPALAEPVRGHLAGLPALVPAAGRPTTAVAGNGPATCLPPTCPNWCRPTRQWSSWPTAAGPTPERCVAARMLTLWDPPRFLPGCSQAVITEPEIAVCRNYDYSPELWERVLYSSRFGDRKVMGNNDCLWGLIDGMNSDGLVISLSFGGRRGSGPGFAVSLVVRYLLEVATSTAQAREILDRMPVAMAYNLTIVDADTTRPDRLCRAGPTGGVQHFTDRHQPSRRDPRQHRACGALRQCRASKLPVGVGVR